MSEGAVWVLVEHEDGKEKSVVHELLSQGRVVADRLGRELQAVLLGQDLEGLCERLQGHPDRILWVKDDSLSPYSAGGYVRAIHQLALQRRPLIILGSSSLRSLDFMPRLAARLGVGMASEVTGLEVTEGGAVRIRRPIHGGRLYAEMEPGGPPPHVLAVRPRSFGAMPGERRAWVEVIPWAIPGEEIRTRQVRKVARPDGGATDLAEARIVVSGGRGMKGPENFTLLEELAQLLGAAVGASRAVVDSKWRPTGDQVGKSGKTVSPDLYMAFGISGAVHHIMGMDTSKCVVAVNNDPKAPIFQVADYGVVDDLFQLLPALIEEIKRAK